jgi:hypothetical protein
MDSIPPYFPSPVTLPCIPLHSFIYSVLMNAGSHNCVIMLVAGAVGWLA